MLYSFPKLLHDDVLQLFWWINNVRAIQLNGRIMKMVDLRPQVSLP